MNVEERQSALLHLYPFINIIIQFQLSALSSSGQPHLSFDKRQLLLECCTCLPFVLPLETSPPPFKAHHPSLQRLPPLLNLVFLVSVLLLGCWIADMGNCQAAEAATVVIQHPGNKIERIYWSVSAHQVMSSNPGHYVALVVTSPTLKSENGTPLKQLKLLRPDDTLLIGQVYRLISFEGTYLIIDIMT